MGLPHPRRGLRWSRGHLPGRGLVPGLCPHLWAGSVSPRVGVSGTGSAFGGLPITVWSGMCWDVRWSAGVNARACVGSLILGHPRSFWGEHTSQQFGSPALLWSVHGGFGRAAERAFYPGILLLPCIFIHCPKLEAPALALSIKRFFFFLLHSLLPLNCPVTKGLPLY